MEFDGREATTACKEFQENAGTPVPQGPPRGSTAPGPVRIVLACTEAKSLFPLSFARRLSLRLRAIFLLVSPKPGRIFAFMGTSSPCLLLFCGFFLGGRLLSWGSSGLRWLYSPVVLATRRAHSHTYFPKTAWRKRLGPREVVSYGPALNLKGGKMGGLSRCGRTKGER